jgi:hypothetical protein
VGADVPDYDIGIDLAQALIDYAADPAKGPFKSLTEVREAKLNPARPKLRVGDDKLSDLLYTFSNQYVIWNAETSELIIKTRYIQARKSIIPFITGMLKEYFPEESPLGKNIFCCAGFRSI